MFRVALGMLVEVWSDVVCPWCYIGKRRFERALERFEHRDEVEIRWRSYELNPNAPATGTAHRPYAERLATKYGTTVEAATAQLERMNRLAAAEGLTYDLARTRGGNTFDAHRLSHLAASIDPGLGADLEEALFRTYFTQLQPIGDRKVLERVGAAVGLDGDEVADVLRSDRFADEVRRDEARAAELGCTGVPFFVVDGRLAVPGAQDAETFLAVLRRAWERWHGDESGAGRGSDDPDRATAAP